MTEKELRKLNRKELLELLLVQTERNLRLQKQLEIAEAKLADRTIRQREAGSIAEAALRLNGVFEAAQAAADQYLANIKAISERLEREERVRGSEAEGLETFELKESEIDIVIPDDNGED